MVAMGIWDATTVTYNFLSPEPATRAIERARKAGLAIIAMKNLLNTNNPVDRLSHPPRQASGSSGLERETLGDIRDGEFSGTTPQQALIKWVLSNEFVDTAVPGMTSFEHLEDDLAVMHLDFTFKTREVLEKHGKMLENRYCRGVLGCTVCEAQCPNGVRVGEVNRCLGYAVGYGDMRLARENYNLLPLGTGMEKCADCNVCRVRCRYGLDVRANMRMAYALFT
jgi:predicted aldo/keto reductase-like oxidoreductase